MRTAIVAALLIAPAAPVFAQQAGPSVQTAGDRDVTVTGRRIQDYRDRLAACLARHCRPDEDIAATLALAEVEFESGGYEAAHRTIRESVGRNRRQAAQHPERVADLFRARGRVARHMGRGDEALRSSHEVLRAFQAGIPTEDHRHFTARLELAESLTLAGRLDRARSELDALVRLARAAGRSDVAALAELRSTWISHLLGPTGETRARLVEMSRDDGNRFRSMGAQLLLARIYRNEGDTRQADAIIARLASRGSGRRSLVYAPTYRLASRDLADQDGSVAVDNHVTDIFGAHWIDVGFWVMPDGRVDGVEILRRRGPAGWADPLLASIRGRRYTASSDGTPTFRLERYTYTAELERVTGTRIPRRAQQATVEYYDLSTGEPPPELIIPARPPAASRSTAG
jgi:tetratricopeptide (TPR) repeat protein